MRQRVWLFGLPRTCPSMQALRGARCTSPWQGRQVMDDGVAAYNAIATPFAWRKAVVFPAR